MPHPVQSLVQFHTGHWRQVFAAPVCHTVSPGHTQFQTPVRAVDYHQGHTPFCWPILVSWDPTCLVSPSGDSIPDIKTDVLYRTGVKQYEMYNYTCTCTYVLTQKSIARLNWAMMMTFWHNYTGSVSLAARTLSPTPCDCLHNYKMEDVYRNQQKKKWWSLANFPPLNFLEKATVLILVCTAHNIKERD